MGGRTVGENPTFVPSLKYDIMNKEQKCDIIEVNRKERNLIELLRAIPYGEVVIFMQDSQPVRIEKVKESIKL